MNTFIAITFTEMTTFAEVVTVEVETSHVQAVEAFLLTRGHAENWAGIFVDWRPATEAEIAEAKPWRTVFSEEEVLTFRPLDEIAGEQPEPGTGGIVGPKSSAAEVLAELMAQYNAARNRWIEAVGTATGFDEWFTGQVFTGAGQ